MKVKLLRTINIILLCVLTIWGIGALWGPFVESSAKVSTVEVYEVSQSTDEIVLAPKHDQLIRFHVLANSDSEQDQALKRAVRDTILKAVSPRLAVSQTLDESRDILKRLSSEMEDIGRSVVMDWDKDYSVKTEYGRFSFPTKSYGSLVLPAGEYEAFRVVIGEGQGSNWWCVLFPPLCFVNIEQSTAVPVDGKVSIPIKRESSDLERKPSEKLTSDRPKVRFFFWEILFKH